MATPLRDLTTKLLGPARGVASMAWTSTMLAAVESHRLFDRALGEGDAQEQIFDRHMRIWTAGLLRMFAVDFHILGTMPPPTSGARLVVSNHRTVLDIGALLTHFGGSVLSRGDLEQWPLLGIAAQRAQTIFVDREDKHSGAAAIRAIRAQLQRGRTISVFPEGTTYLGDEVRPFLAGAFVACRKLDVEFVPVGLAYPPGIPWNSEDESIGFVDHVSTIGSHPSIPAVMAIGEPFRSPDRAAKLAVRLHDEVQTLVTQARTRLDGRLKPPVPA